MDKAFRVEYFLLLLPRTLLNRKMRFRHRDSSVYFQKTPQGCYWTYVMYFNITN